LRVNGWGSIQKEDMPKLTHTDLDQVDINNLGKLVQRLGATNFLPRTKETVNEILTKSGFKYQLSDGDIEKNDDFTANTLFPEIFTDNENSAGQGLEEGMPNGTGKSSKNNSATNMDNAS